MIPRSERYAMVESNGKLSLRNQCELLCIPRTTFYYKPKSMGQVNLYIMKLMDEQYLRTPFYFPMIHVLKDFFPEQYQLSMNEVNLGKVILDVRSIEQLFTLDGINFQNMNHDQLSGVIRQVATRHSDLELMKHLKEIKKRLEHLIISHFFKLVKNLPTQFLFPMLEYSDFKDSLENGKNFTQEQESQIHRARTRHNSALKRVGETMGISELTGHVPRHTLANHMADNGNSEEEIRQVLGHSNIHTTKIYLRERIGFSGSYDIMKKFHQLKIE